MRNTNPQTIPQAPEELTRPPVPDRFFFPTEQSKANQPVPVSLLVLPYIVLLLHLDLISFDFDGSLAAAGGAAAGGAATGTTATLALVVALVEIVVLVRRQFQFGQPASKDIACGTEPRLDIGRVICRWDSSVQITVVRSIREVESNQCR